MKHALLLILLLQSISAFAQTRMVMLTINTNKATDQFTLEPYELAEIKSIYDATSTGQFDGGAKIEIRKGTDTFDITGERLTPISNNHRGPIVFTGPAVVTLKSRGPTSAEVANAFVTFEIKPESFPPDKTFNLPAGMGARVALECSTNLTQWTELYSVTETNSPTHKFFRIKAERLP